MVKLSAGVLATGSYLPTEEVSNEEVAARCGVTAEWIERKTQIKSRRYAAPDEATSDLATRAASDALARAAMPAESLDYIVVATSTGDMPQPPTSALVQHALGAYNAACFDINVVCSGFVYGLELARGFVTLRPNARVLVVAADLYSRVVDFSDRRTAVLFADGAGAAIIGAVDEPYGVLGSELATRGDASQLIRVEAGGSRRPASKETLAEGLHFFRMEGRAVREFVAEQVPAAVDRLMGKVGLTVRDIDHFIPHQANGVMLQELIQSSELTNARTHRTLEKYGNIGCASVAVTLDEASRTGQLDTGDLVLLAGFGGGMSVGLCLMRWQKNQEGGSA